MLKSEFTLALVARVGLAKNGVTVSRHYLQSGYHYKSIFKSEIQYLSALKMLPDPVLERLLSVSMSNISDNLGEEYEYFLIGKSMKGSS